MLFYTTSITSRLQYICDFFAKELTGAPFSITTNNSEFAQHQGAKINYSNTRISSGEFYIKPHQILFEANISEQDTRCFTVNGHKAFFATNGDVEFDILAASFYLISRYEEYLPHTLDEYGRYDHRQSLAYRENFLNIPLINYWLRDFRQLFQLKFPGCAAGEPEFQFIPSYDIDMAWTYQNKGWWRNTGSAIRNIFTGNWKTFGERMRVLLRKEKDPYDTFFWMDQLHVQYALKPYYFFLLAARTGRYDKNISPANKAMKQLISEHLTRYPVGIHPSWQTGDDLSLLKQEILNLSGISGNIVRASRQHFIRMKLPDTYRALEQHGIQFDFSMGYGGINGFRASVATAFGWYDLAAERSTSLVLFPFCYMEATSFYELKQTASEALIEMQYYYDQVKEVNGLFSMIWHNSFLGSDHLHAGWREMYAKFIANNCSDEPKEKVEG